MAREEYPNPPSRVITSLLMYYVYLFQLKQPQTKKKLSSPLVFLKKKLQIKVIATQYLKNVCSTRVLRLIFLVCYARTSVYGVAPPLISEVIYGRFWSAFRRGQ